MNTAFLYDSHLKILTKQFTFPKQCCWWSHTHQLWHHKQLRTAGEPRPPRLGLFFYLTLVGTNKPLQMWSTQRISKHLFYKQNCSFGVCRLNSCNWNAVNSKIISIVEHQNEGVWIITAFCVVNLYFGGCFSLLLLPRQAASRGRRLTIATFPGGLSSYSLRYNSWTKVSVRIDAI